MLRDSLQKERLSEPQTVAGPVVTGGGAFDDVGAFRNTVHALATTTGCAACHGTLTAPLHSAPDVSAAYQAALPLIDFNNPAASGLAVQAGNGHCGVSICVGQSAAMSDAIQRWKDLRDANP